MNSIIVKCQECGTKNKIPTVKQHLRPKCGRCHHPLDLQNFAVPVELTDSDFAQFINQASLPIIVDFFSPTCGPCQMLAPVIDNLARNFFGSAIVAKLDTSRNPFTPGRYQIKGVPTLLFFKRGQLVDQVVGALPEEALVQKIQQMI